GNLKANRRAKVAGDTVRFQVADVTRAGDFGEPFDFFFDGGCYQAVRLANAAAYFRGLRRQLRPKAKGLILMGDDAEPEDEDGPPTVSEAELREEWGRHFDVL